MLKIFTMKTIKHKKEIVQDIRRWKDLPFSWIGGINLFKWPYYQNPFKKINNLLQNFNDYFPRYRNINPYVESYFWPSSTIFLIT
jgi:hypothetical protein